MATKEVRDLKPSDIIRHCEQDCLVLTDRQDHIDVTGLPVGRWLVRLIDFDPYAPLHVGFAVYGDDALVEVIER